MLSAITLSITNRPYVPSVIVLIFISLNVFVLTVIYAECHKRALYTECHYTECHYAHCRYTECHYAKCLYTECQYNESRYAKCHGAKIISSQERRQMIVRIS
jgi:hypothetical protein